MHALNRRVIVKLGAGVATAATLPRRAWAAAPAEPHFFLMLNFQGSLDSSYLFDARPLSMTTAGKIQNYLGKDPGIWTGVDGVSTRATDLVAPLKPLQPYFSVLNGVHMAVSFDGHEQNANTLVTGNPFGGDAFFANLNHETRPAPLDFLQLGDMFGVVMNNGSAGVNLEAAAAPKLSATVGKSLSSGADPAVMDLVQARFAADGGGSGAFATGSRRMAGGLLQARGLATTLASMQFATQSDPDPLKAALAVVGQYFLKGATRSALITLPMQGKLDTHSPGQAAAQPAVYAQIVADIAALFQTLKDTPVADGSDKSLLDVTTVMVASEFGRSMYQRGLAMDKTGTDHNPLSNEILLGGKGIKGGLVVGASDLQNVTDGGQLEPFSAAHRSFDELGMKTMGKVFDFDTLRATAALPDVYDPAQYLGVGSVVNTIYQLFGIDPSHYWTLGRNLPAARILSGLIG